MRRATVSGLLVMALVLVIMPKAAIPVLAYRVALSTSQEWGRYTSGGELGATFRVGVLKGTNNDAKIVREACDEALRFLEDELGFLSGQPFTVLVGDMPVGTAGYYRFGTVGLVPPSLWAAHLDEEQRSRVYRARGPALHELTHYAVDKMAHGNYPVWLSEGLALNMELKYQGLRWSAVNRHEGVIPYASLDRYLAHPLYYGDAYGQALSMVEYMYYLAGQEGIVELLTALGRGQSFERSLSSTYSLSVDSFMEQWYYWLQAG